MPMVNFERVADKKRTDFIVQSIKQNIPAGADILDVGCGNGLISRALAFEGYRVLGVDVSEKTIAAARSFTVHPNLRFRVVAANELMPERERYGAIICSEVLEHLPDPVPLLKIIHRSLTQDGMLIVTVPNGYGPRELLVTKPVQTLQKTNGIIWRIISKIKKLFGYSGTTIQSSADDLRHLQFFSVKTLSSLAASTGFRIEKTTAANFIEQVFPFSIFARRSKALQRIDCKIADMLPLRFSSGFMCVWKKL